MVEYSGVGNAELSRVINIQDSLTLSSKYYYFHGIIHLWHHRLQSLS